MNVAARKVIAGDWESIKSTIRENGRFLITTHVQADPDALGSEIALAESLRAAGKQVTIVNPTPVSPNYSFIDKIGEIVVFDPKAGLDPFEFDVVFILDISRWERLGAMADAVRDSGRRKICMDHHPYSGGHADYHAVDTSACASAELVYDLVCDLGIPVSRPIAEALYTAILADTGSFSFSNTSPRSHQIACELLNHSIPARSLYEKLYQNHTPKRLVFLGKALAALRLDCNDRMAWISIDHTMLRENGIPPEEVDGFVDMARNCRNVLLSIVFLEVEPNDIKISLRAKGNFNANQLAGKFGGGGHNHASGIRLSGTLQEVENTVLAEARKAVESCPA